MKKNWNNYIEKVYCNKQISNNIIKAYKDFFKSKNINCKDMSILEIGSGHGIYTILLSKIFKQIIAIEPNKKLFEALNTKIKLDKIKNVKTEQLSIENYKTDIKFDMILCINSFHLITNKKKILLKFNKMLKNHKYLFISEPLFKLYYKNVDNKISTDTLLSITSSKKFNLIFYGFVRKNEILYLLKKN